MSTTRPTGDQLRFQSSQTGEHVLDTYLEAAEKGGRTVGDMLSDLWNPLNNGELRRDLWTLRVNPNTFVLEQRIGDYVDPEAGWIDVENTSFFNYRGDHVAAVAYERLDLVSYADTIYLCVIPHTSAGAIPSGTNFRTVVNLGASGVTSFNSRTGTVTLTDVDITDALGYSPTSPATLSSSLANYLPLAGGTMTGTLNGATINATNANITTELSITGSAPRFNIRRNDIGGASLLTADAGNGLTFNSGDEVTEWARFNGSGFFGIGTAAPASHLHVDGDVTITDDSSTSAEKFQFGVTNAGHLQFSSDTSGSFFRLDKTGVALFGPTLTRPMAKITVTGTGRAITLDSNSDTVNASTSIDFNLATGQLGSVNPSAQIAGVGKGSGEGEIAFSTRSGATMTEKVRLTKDGKLGVGLANPGYRVDVSSSDANALAVRAASPIFDMLGTSLTVRQQVSGSLFSIGTLTAGGTVLFKSGANIERMRLDSSGRLGIGCTPTSRILEVGGSAEIRSDTAANLYWRADQDSANHVASAILQTTGQLDFTAPSHFTFNGGDVGIGTTSPTNDLDIFTSGTFGGLNIRSSSGSAIGLAFDTNRGAAGLVLGRLDAAWNGTSVAYIDFQSGSDAVNRDNGRVVFATAEAGTTVERMRIDEAGNVGIGTASPNRNLVVEAADPVLTVRGGDANNVYITMGDSGSDFLGAFRMNTSSGLMDIASLGDLRLMTNSTERIRITNGGNVGIGTTTPDYALEVEGNSPYISISNLDETRSGLLFQDAQNIGERWLMEFDASNAFFHMGRLESVGTKIERLTIDNTGRVGIGTTTPSDRLEVITTSDSAVAGINMFNQGAGGDSALRLGHSGTRWAGLVAEKLTTGNNHDLTFWTNAAGAAPTEKMRLNDSGHVIVGGTTVNNPATFSKTINVQGVSAGLVLSETDTSQDWTLGASGGNFYLYENTAIRMTVDTTGNVGIGTTSPVRKLHIEDTGNSSFIRFGSTGTNFSEIAHGISAGNILISADAGNTQAGSHIQFSVDTTERARITSDGRLGVGTIAPANPLHVTGSGAVAGTFERTGSDNNVAHEFKGTSSSVYFGKGTGTAFGFATTSNVGGAPFATITPAAIESIAGIIKDVSGNVRSIPRVARNGTLIASDNGHCNAVTTGATVPASVFAAGDAVTIYNNSASAITITQGAGLTLRFAGTATTGNRTLAARGMATVWFNSATEAIISGPGVT